MSLQIVIRPEAEAEMGEAFDWYEEQVLGLGSDFLLSIDAILNSIIRNPRGYPTVHKTVRRALTRRFPYEVFFTVEETQIVVIGVFHAKRDPKHWQART